MEPICEQLRHTEVFLLLCICPCATTFHSQCENGRCPTVLCCDIVLHRLGKVVSLIQLQIGRIVLLRQMIAKVNRGRGHGISRELRALRHHIQTDKSSDTGGFFRHLLSSNFQNARSQIVVRAGVAGRGPCCERLQAKTRQQHNDQRQRGETMECFFHRDILLFLTVPGSLRSG